MSEQSRSGRKPRVTDRELLAVLRKTNDPVLSTAEVADELPIKRRATLTRLQRLAESGVLARKQTGGRNTVWWLVDDRPHTKERDPEEILNDLETFLSERDADTSLPSLDEVRDDYHARRHRENLERLATNE